MNEMLKMVVLAGFKNLKHLFQSFDLLNESFQGCLALKRHHRDVGGDPSQFQRAAEAKERLLPSVACPGASLLNLCRNHSFEAAFQAL